MKVVKLYWGLEVKQGRVRLIEDPEAFKNSFVRFVGDGLNGWSEIKQLRAGQEGTVIKTYGNQTVTMIFDDGKKFDFPFETVEAQLCSTFQYWKNGAMIDKMEGADYDGLVK